MLDDIGSTLIKDLLAHAKPTQIQANLDNWHNLKTFDVNIATSQIDEIIITARTAETLACRSALTYADHSGLRASGKYQFTSMSSSENSPIVQNYINAQLNYEKICNFLGIVKSTAP